MSKKSVKIDDTLHEHTFVADDADTSLNETGDITMQLRKVNSAIGTPLMATPSRTSPNSMSDLDNDLDDAASFHSQVDSIPGSRIMSGMVSPSNLPDSPGQITPNFIHRNRIHNPIVNKSLFSTAPMEMSAQVSSSDKSKGATAGTTHLGTHSYDYSNTPTQPTTTDEMRTFGDEGSMSPMTGLSEITVETSQGSQLGAFGFSFHTALRNNNEGNSDDMPYDLGVQTGFSFGAMRQDGFTRTLGFEEEVRIQSANAGLLG